MDDEDRALAAETQTLRPNDAYNSLSASAADENPTPARTGLTKPSKDTVVLRGLRKMRWQEGQGVGALPEASLEGEASAAAPRNIAITKMPQVRSKQRKGVDFESEARLGSSEQRQTGSDDDEPFVLPSNSHDTKGIGTGVLDDEDDDEFGHYSIRPKATYKKTLGSKTKSATASISDSHTSTRSKPSFRPKKSLFSKTGFRECRDGKLPPEDYLLADSMSSMRLKDAQHRRPRPSVPEEWQPATEIDTSESAAKYKSTKELAKASVLDSRTRGRMLGLEQLPRKSVFELMSPEARGQLAAISGRKDLPAAGGNDLPRLSKTDAVDDLSPPLPSISKASAEAALKRASSGWTPYADNEEKRKRYREFLELHTETTPEQDQLKRPASLDKEQWLRELEEFAQAAEVFKPVSGMMASRFTSSAAATPESQPENGADPLRPAKTNDYLKPVDPAEQAASMGMFGKLTRTTEAFYPTRLLCKRFNVKMPNGAGVDGGQATASTKPARELISDADMATLKDATRLHADAEVADEMDIDRPADEKADRMQIAHEAVFGGNE